MPDDKAVKREFELSTYTELLANAENVSDGFQLTIPEVWMQGRTTYGGLSAALGYAERLRMHGFWRDAWARATSLAQLGRTDEAAAALRDMLDAYLGDLSRFETDAHEPVFFAQPTLHERVSEGLRKAEFDAGAPTGLHLPKEEGEK